MSELSEFMRDDPMVQQARQHAAFEQWLRDPQQRSSSTPQTP